MTAEEMWEKSGLRGEYEAWAFEGAPDKLAKLVLEGIKTATCSSCDLYEAEGEPFPKVGDYSVILDSKENAVCIIQTTKLYVETFDRVSADHAYKEGEGDRSLAYWREVHREFFAEELKTIGRPFEESIRLLCEEFVVVYR